MPRVNRDLQRRLAARRERDRRRPTDRRYNFTTSEPALEDEEELLGRAAEQEDGQVAVLQEEKASTRGGTRAAPKPFSAYKDEYAYVSSDLRRVAAVIGGLLVGLIVLYFLLPVLVH